MGMSPSTCGVCAGQNWIETVGHPVGDGELVLEKWKCFLLGKNQLITLKLVPENNLFEIIVVYYLDKNSKAF